MRAEILSLLFVAACGADAPPDFLDGDGDLIADDADACPEAPETVNGYQDRDGCPDAAPVATPADQRIAGVWTGTMLLTSPDLLDAAEDMAFSLQVFVTRADEVEIVGMCPTLTEPWPMGANGRAAGATQPYICPPGLPAGCRREGQGRGLGLVYLSAAVELSADGLSLSVAATGATGCSYVNNGAESRYTAPFTLSGSLTRQP